MRWVRCVCVLVKGGRKGEDGEEKDEWGVWKDQFLFPPPFFPALENECKKVGDATAARAHDREIERECKKTFLLEKDGLIE